MSLLGVGPERYSYCPLGLVHHPVLVLHTCKARAMGCSGSSSVSRNRGGGGLGLYAGLSYGVNSFCLRAIGVVNGVAKSGRRVGEVGDGPAASSNSELEESSMGFFSFFRIASSSDDVDCCSSGTCLSP